MNIKNNSLLIGGSPSKKRIVEEINVSTENFSKTTEYLKLKEKFDSKEISKIDFLKTRGIMLKKYMKDSSEFTTES